MARIQVRKKGLTVLDADVEQFILQLVKISPPFEIEVSIPFEKQRKERFVKTLFRGTVRQRIKVEIEAEEGK